MTLQRLDNFRHLRTAIMIETERLQDLYARVGIRTPIMNGMPSAKGARDKLGEIVPEIVDEANFFESRSRPGRKRRRRSKTGSGKSLTCRQS